MGPKMSVGAATSLLDRSVPLTSLPPQPLISMHPEEVDVIVCGCAPSSPPSSSRWTENNRSTVVAPLAAWWQAAWPTPTPISRSCSSRAVLTTVMIPGSTGKSQQCRQLRQSLTQPVALVSTSATCRETECEFHSTPMCSDTHVWCSNDKATFYTDSMQSSHLRGRRSIVP